MGSSSSFAVGLLLALKAMRGEAANKAELATMAIELEQDWLKEKVGSQDQVAAAYGGFNLIDFGKDGRISVTALPAAPKRIRTLERRLMLFYTGLSRFASDVAADVIANIPQREAQLHRMKELVEQATAVLCDGDLDDFGRMLDTTWRLKRELSPMVSNNGIDAIYDRARRAGALGGKLLGAGTSGFMLFYVPEHRQPLVMDELRELIHVPFQFETEGATLLPTIQRGTNIPESIPGSGDGATRVPA